MHPDLEKLVAREKIEPAVAEKLDLLPPGTFCDHKSWGVGKVSEWDRLNVKVVIDFESKPGHELGMKFAASSLTPLEEDSFLAMRHSQLEDLQALAQEDPVGVVRLALQHGGGTLMLDQLEELIKGRVVPDGKYKSWWDSAKRKLREDRSFIVPTKRNEPLELRDEDVDASEHLINDFREARDLRAKGKAVETIIKDLNVFDNPVETLRPVIDEISEVARKGIKLQYAPAVELILAREELQNRIKGYEPDEERIRVSEILASDKERIPGLLEELSLTRLRQVLKSFENAFGEENWVAEMLNLLPDCNLRSISEIAHFLKESDHVKELLAHFENGLQQRSLSSDALAWICRERKGVAKPLFDPTISLAVMSTLEADQLNEEGAVRSANRLRDLVAEDGDLIPDFIEGANPNLLRNFASRLAVADSFDELTRKSLMARVIKRHPDLLDLVSGREEQEEDALIVSEESLAKRQAAYDKLVREDIPQNREDIKVARAYGDLRENFEYKAAREQQRVLMNRQSEMDRELKLARATDFSDPDLSQVSIGTVVELESLGGGEDLCYTILGAWDSDLEKGVIAYLSERGAAMLGKKVGEEVEFPSGEGGASSKYRIRSISAYRS